MVLFLKVNAKDFKATGSKKSKRYFLDRFSPRHFNEQKRDYQE